MILFLISTLTAVIFSFLCSLTEAVLLGLNKVKIETDKNKGKKYALILDKLTSNINRPISAILILNTIAHTGGATVAGSAFDKTFGTEWIWLFSLIFTVVILFGTEIFPKMYGVANTDKLAKYIAAPLNLTVKILYPLVLVTEFFSRLIVSKKETPQYSLDDLKTIAEVAEDEKIITKAQEDIIIKTTRLKCRRLEEIMLPMGNVILFKHSQSIADYITIAEKHLHTRYPYTPTGLAQDINGYINLKEITLKSKNSEINDVEKFVRPILFANKDTSVMKLMNDMKKKRFHIIIVQDDDKNNIGMITLENIVEEVVGEIADEFDVK